MNKKLLKIKELSKAHTKSLEGDDEIEPQRALPNSISTQPDSKADNENYQINQHHRNGNSAKSQWRITINEETASFTYSKNNKWIITDKGWGLHFINGQVSWLGVAQDHSTQVFIAKFVSKDGAPWHGYPADYRNNSHDIPEPEILQHWLNNKLLSAPKIRKITKGQPCNP